ncbi:MAG TPA: RagB/SusD family nutrient uptake outer membrane protein [Flavisolibacter sp.]|nr:RagB/SusD family nutrient uptake outer membrane protein [Flavisolibacter sp.]
MHKRFFIPFIASAALLSGCQKFLDRKPLDASASSTFLSNEAEMDLGLTGVYASSVWVVANNIPLMYSIESTTDLAIRRTGNTEDQIAMGDAGPFLVSNGLTVVAWNQEYKLVARANQQLHGMKRAEANVDAKTYGRIRAEVLVLRAWAYFHLMSQFGDVPYYREPLATEQIFTLSRTPVATIVPDLYKDLDEAVTLFDAATTPAVQAMGKVNKGVALGLKAKLALFIKDYNTAATATKTIIDGAQYGLNPRYTDLFVLAGQQANASREIMFNQTYPTDILDPQNWLAVITIPRQVGTSQSSHFPSQQLVDKFETKDGKRIDESPLYDPAQPSRNRDNRLRWTVYMPGDTMVHNTAKAPSLPYVQPKERTIFNIHTNQRFKWNWTTNKFDTLATNIDWINYLTSPWFAGATGSSGGVGYVWRKYVDSTQYSWETKTGFILMRYAEILLTYAEAKIELGQIDGTVVSAINLVRARAGQPAITAGSQAQMRQIVRRERAVEFGGEGLRLYDLRRWDIVVNALNGPVVGAARNPADVPATPVFNIDDIPNYSNSLTKRIATRGQTRANTEKHKLWPIPQGEIDKNKGLTQNKDW